MVDDFLATLQVSCFVALYFANYDKLPCIGKVLAVEEDNFKVHYWKGTYCGKWTPQHVPRQKSRPWVEILPKSCIVCSSFELTEDNKLIKPSTRKFLKERYVTLRKNHSRVFSSTDVASKEVQYVKERYHPSFSFIIFDISAPNMVFI